VQHRARRLAQPRAVPRPQGPRRPRRSEVALSLGMILSDLPSPAEAGFAKAENRLPRFRIMP
jgi:hypothetical protein